MPETWQLYRQIRGGQELTLPRGIPAEEGHASLQEALTRLRRALDALEAAWQALQAVTAEFAERSESG